MTIFLKITAIGFGTSVLLGSANHSSMVEHVSSSRSTSLVQVQEDEASGSAQRSEPSVKRSVVIRGERLGQDWVGRGRLLDLGDGTWLYGYVQGSHHSSVIDSKKALHLRFSRDQGRSWTEADRLADGGNVRGFPIVSSDGRSYSEIDLIRCPNGDLLCLYRINGADPEVLARRQLMRLGEGQKRSRDGGRTWTEEGIVMDRPSMKASLDHCVVDQTILVPFLTGAIDGAPGRLILVASIDNGRTWDERSEIGAIRDRVGETGIVALDGEQILVVCRTRTEDRTLMRSSDDLGRSWGPWHDITDQVGVVQQPRLRRFATVPDRLFLFGRHRYEETVQRNGLWWSDDDGQTWDGFDLDEADYIDTGYGDALLRDDGTLVLMAYRGRDGRSDTHRYLIEDLAKAFPNN